MLYSFVRVSALLFLLCFSALTAKADTYSIRNIGNAKYNFISAGNDYGDYTIRTPGGSGGCPIQNNFCYFTYSAYTGQTSVTLNPIALPVNPNPVPGAGCTFNAATEPGATSICNNGYQMLYGYVGNATGLWSATGNQLALLSGGGILTNIVLTANGNVFFGDGTREYLYAGLNLTTLPAAVPLTVTPEPAPLMSVISGVMLVWAYSTRRRYLPATC